MFKIMPRAWGLALLVLLGLAAAPAAAAEMLYLLGKIGEHKVAASLERQGEHLSGWYFYASQAREIRLEGTLDDQGVFSLEESSDGKVTGLLAGQARQGRWSGTWRRTAQAAPLTLNLEENRQQLARLSGDFSCQARRREARFGYTFHWQLNLALQDGQVKRLAADQGSRGDYGEVQTCSLTMKELEQVPSPNGLLLRVKEPAGEDEKRATKGCYLRLVGDEDLLWLIIGEGSGQGGDCRSLSSMMLCSPRAFWNDLVLDRHTQKCRPLQ